MTRLSLIATPYAKAVFEYAKQAGVLADWQLFLNVAANVAQQADAIQFLHNPRFERDQKLSFMQDVIKPQSAEQQNFLHLLSEYQRFDAFPEIAAQYNQMLEDDKKMAKVKITSAFELSDKEREKLIKALGIRLQQAIMPEFVVDQGLMGGCVIQAGDFVIDGSVRSKIQRMKQSLND